MAITDYESSSRDLQNHDDYGNHKGVLTGLLLTGVALAVIAALRRLG